MNTGRFSFKLPEIKLHSVPVVRDDPPETSIEVGCTQDIAASLKLNKPVWVYACKVKAA